MRAVIHGHAELARHLDVVVEAADQGGELNVDVFTKHALLGGNQAVARDAAGGVRVAGGFGGVEGGGRKVVSAELRPVGGFAVGGLGEATERSRKQLRVKRQHVEVAPGADIELGAAYGCVGEGGFKGVALDGGVAAREAAKVAGSAKAGRVRHGKQIECAAVAAAGVADHADARGGGGGEVAVADFVRGHAWLVAEVVVVAKA